MPAVRASAPVGVVGLGAIGASIGMALGSGGQMVMGADISAHNREVALRRGAVAMICQQPADFARCRVVFVAVPPSAVVEVVRDLLEATEATIVDVASVKRPVAEAVADPRFVPSHPLAGTHLSGPAAARADLFRRGTWVMCPRRATARSRLVLVESLIRAMGAEPLHMDAGEHDAAVASTSHLPHVAAAGLAHALRYVDRSLARNLVGQGFRDATRIARANPCLWTDITLDNREEVGRSIGLMVSQLQEVARALASGDRERVFDFFAEAFRLIEDALPAPADATGRTRVVSFRHPRRRTVSAELGRVH